MLACENVEYSYGKKRVLHRVSFSLKRGRVASLVGPNASGKTTLFKVMAGMLEPHSGKVTVDGTPISKLTSSQVAKKVRYIRFYDELSEDFTAEEFLLLSLLPEKGFLGGSTADEVNRVRRALEKMGALELCSRSYNELSHGEKSRISMAISLVANADYLLLDEVFPFVDVGCVPILKGLVADLASSGKGIGLITHDISLALSVSDEVALLKNGSIMFTGTSGDLLRDPEPLSRTFGVRMVLKKSESGWYLVEVCGA